MRAAQEMEKRQKKKNQLCGLYSYILRILFSLYCLFTNFLSQEIAIRIRYILWYFHCICSGNRAWGIVSFFAFFFFFCFFLGPHLQHLEVPRLGVELKLYLLAYTTATATTNLNRVCKLHHNSWQYQILNPLIGAEDQTRISSWVHFHWATVGTSKPKK